MNAGAEIPRAVSFVAKGARRPRVARPPHLVVDVGHQKWHATLAPAGLVLREYRHRHSMVLPWSTALAAAERIAGELLYRERQSRRRSA